MSYEGKNLTKSEEELMDFFWNGGALTSLDIMNSDKERCYKKGYVHIMLRSLLKKEMIKVCGVVLCNRKYARQFIATMTREEYIMGKIMSKCPDMKSVARVTVAMAKEADKKEREELVEELKKIIDELEEDKDAAQDGN